MELDKDSEEKKEEEIEIDILDETDDDTIIRSYYEGGQEAVEKEEFSDLEESDEEHPTVEGKKYYRVKTSRDVVKVMDKTIDQGDTTVYVKYPKSKELKTNFRLMHKTSTNPGNYMLYYAGTQDSPSYEKFDKLKGEKETEKEAFTNFQSFVTGEVPKAWSQEQQKLSFGLMSITSGSEYERSTFGLQSVQVESENIQSGLSTFKDSFTKGVNKSEASFLGAKKNGGSTDLRRVERGHLDKVDKSRKKRQADAIRKNIKSRKSTKMKLKGKRVGKKVRFSESETEAWKKAAVELLREQGKDVLCRMKVLKKK